MHVVHYDTLKKLIDAADSLKSHQQQFMLRVLRGRGSGKYSAAVSQLQEDELWTLFHWVRDKKRQLVYQGYELHSHPLEIALLVLAEDLLKGSFARMKLRGGEFVTWQVDKYLQAVYTTGSPQPKINLKQVIQWQVSDMPKGHQRWTAEQRKEFPGLILPSNRQEAARVLLRVNWDAASLHEYLIRSEYHGGWRLAGTSQRTFVLYDDIFNVLNESGNTKEIHDAFKKQELVGMVA